MDKLFLIDAYAFIYRSYYAFIRIPRINSKGLNTSAILGFVNTLEEVLNKENPTHIGVVFDPSGPTFRHKVYPQYKAQREETPEVIRLSVPIIKKIIEAYNIPMYQVDGYEADDVVGTLSQQASQQGLTTYLMTPDKDYAQLVNDNVFMYRPKKGDKEYEILGVEEVKAKYNITTTQQVIDLLGLMGDTSDNIPGCPGIGEVTAKKLIAQFGNVEKIIENIHLIKGALQGKISSNIELLRMSKFLATIKTDVPIQLNLDELKRKTINKGRLKEIFDDLEFRQLSERILGKENNKKPQSMPSLFEDNSANNQGDLFYENLSNVKTTNSKYILIDLEDIDSIINKYLITTKSISFSVETTNYNPISTSLVGFSFCCEENEAYYVHLPKERQETIEIVKKFKRVLENRETLKIVHDMKFFIMVMANYGIKIEGPLFDTMIAHYVVQSEIQHNLDYLSEIYLKQQMSNIKDLLGNGRNVRNIESLSASELLPYSCEKADVTFRLKTELEKEINKYNVENLFYQIEMPLVEVLATMERNGVCVDTKALNETAIIFTNRLLTIENNIYQLAGTAFNISSPKQVGEILFEKLKLVDKPKKTKTGQYITSEDVLENLKSLHPIIEKILEHRGLKKLINTYLETLPTLINKETGKIHTSLNQTITATGRLSSSNPNLQNIPVRNEDGKEIRKAFVPEQGHILFSADYSQIELRIMAHLSHDQNMISDFLKGDDIHAATASKVFKVPLQDVTREQRSKAKTANFGIIYGISVFGLAERLKVSRNEAKTLIDDYFITYPDIKKYMSDSIEKARKQGYIETIFNRKRYLPDINSHNSVVRGYAERNAINAPIQGSAADIIKVAMINIHRRFKEENLQSKMILQVHDELIFSVLPNEKETVEQIVIKEMEQAYKMSVPLKSDCGWGKNWLEAH